MEKDLFSAQHPSAKHCIYQKKVSEGKYRSHRYFFCPLTGEAEVLTLINFDQVGWAGAGEQTDCSESPWTLG